MKDLLSRLENAPEGSRELRELDCDIFNADPRYEIADRDRRTYVNDKGPFGRNVHNDVRLEVPHYTTSLDAKLPGENITKVEAPHDVSFPENEKCNTMWRATCVVNESEHPGIFGYGHTEALARRHAALRASLKARESKEENHD